MKFRAALGIAAAGLLLGAPAGGALTEPLDFERLSLEQGLSQSIIERIVQDRRGFLWFVTEDGVNRYDGYRFQVLRHDPDDSNSLSYNDVKCLHEDRDGILWIGTFGAGLDRYDPRTGRFAHHRQDPSAPSSLAGDIVRVVLEDRKGALWSGTQGGGLDRLRQHFRCGQSVDRPDACRWYTMETGSPSVQ